MSSDMLYKITFLNKGEVFEIHATEVWQSEMLGFIEVADLQLDEESALVIDPSEEKIRNEFKGVTRTYLPMSSILRIDEVVRKGQNKVTSMSSDNNNVTAFPSSAFTPPGGNKK